jgi:hypothetical protein
MEDNDDGGDEDDGGSGSDMVGRFLVLLVILDLSPPEMNMASRDTTKQPPLATPLSLPLFLLQLRRL